MLKQIATDRKSKNPITDNVSAPFKAGAIKLEFCFKASVEKGSPAASDHSHQVLELVYFLSGSGKTTIKDVTRPIRPGTFCVIPQGVIHNQISETTISSICLGLSGFNLDDSVGLWADPSGDIRRCALTLMDELLKRKTAYSMVTEGYLLILVGLVKRAIKDNVPPDRRQALVARAVQIIEAKEGNLSIDDIAGQLFVSKDYLRHLFTHYTGQSPMQALIAARIEHAKTLLLDDSLSIGQIADLCGFESPYYFSRLFKKVTGRSPRSFRES